MATLENCARGRRRWQQSNTSQGLADVVIGGKDHLCIEDTPLTLRHVRPREMPQARREEDDVAGAQPAGREGVGMGLEPRLRLIVGRPMPQRVGRLRHVRRQQHKRAIVVVQVVESAPDRDIRWMIARVWW